MRCRCLRTNVLVSSVAFLGSYTPPAAIVDENGVALRRGGPSRAAPKFRLKRVIQLERLLACEVKRDWFGEVCTAASSYVMIVFAVEVVHEHV
jgi:hypothetical protein